MLHIINSFSLCCTCIYRPTTHFLFFPKGTYKVTVPLTNVADLFYAQTILEVLGSKGIGNIPAFSRETRSNYSVLPINYTLVPVLSVQNVELPAV